MVVYISSGDMNELHEHSSYVLKFVSHRCKGCSILNPLIHDKFKSKVIFQVDIDEHPSIANTYNIKTIPTILNVENNKICDTYFNYKDLIDNKSDIDPYMFYNLYI